MKRAERTALISQMLTHSPNHLFTLDEICNRFNISKTTASEDVNILKNAFQHGSFGQVITKKGPGGGFIYTPNITKETAHTYLHEICIELSNSMRVLGGGFLFTSDIMFNPSIVSKMASIFVSEFKSLEPDYIVTVETKGIPLALMTAELLNIPAVVVRREHKISEGPTLSINYFSSAAGRMKKMSISKMSINKNSKAIIIDDFMRAGGSIKGVYELLTELNVDILTVGVGIASKTPEEKKISDYLPLIYLDNIDEEEKLITIHPNYDLLNKLSI